MKKLLLLFVLLCTSCTKQITTYEYEEIKSISSQVLGGDNIEIITTSNQIIQVPLTIYKTITNSDKKVLVAKQIQSDTIDHQLTALLILLGIFCFIIIKLIFT